MFGPKGTTELAMRFGLNSGPTTAGVLRGEKSRFQLFGDVRPCHVCKSTSYSTLNT
jgi:class 3 adenylate cyclase